MTIKTTDHLPRIVLGIFYYSLLYLLTFHNTVNHK
jgi:hypothetical protein